VENNKTNQKTIKRCSPIREIIMNKILPNRQSNRLKNYDYSKPGYYFITICVQNREHLLGEIIDGNMKINSAGKMIQAIWNQIPQFYDGIQIDEFIVMPNHIHGVIHIVGAGPCACPINRACPNANVQPQFAQPQHGQPRCRQPQLGQPHCRQPHCRHPQKGQPQGVAPTVLSLPDVVHRLKTMTTKKYVDGVKQYNWSSFPGRLWQRNYWEHIVRNENELNRIRDYIRHNPQKWEMDKLNGGCGNILMEQTAEYGSEIWMV